MGERRRQPSTPWDSQEITNGLEARRPEARVGIPPVAGARAARRATALKCVTACEFVRNATFGAGRPARSV
jgi:hypothetical protein